MHPGERAPTDRLGTTIGDRWQLEHVLGTGASATVFAARDASGLRAAVKVLHAEVANDAALRERFVREGRLAAEVRHPGIVRVLEERADDPDQPYLALELVEGETLGARAARQGTLPFDELLPVVDQVLDVLAATHAVGVVHRDLKPENVLLGADGQVRLLDFGVARGPGRGAGTRAGLAIGTAAYMAPEQALGRQDAIDARTDLFAVGAMLFRLASGRRLHEATTETALIAAMATRPAPRFSSVCPTSPPDVAAVIDLALGFDRSARYPDARTMQRDVQALLAGRPPPHAASVLAAAEQATVAPGSVVANVLANARRSARPSAPPRPAAGASTPPPGTEELVGKVVAGRYRVERLLGAGGMGAVYRAEHVHMRKTVALKVLHREMTLVPEVVARFEREAIAASRVEHPNVATATDFGKLEDGAFYLVLEFVEGKSLRSVIDAEGPLPPSRAAHVAAQIASALAEAHAQGVVHRDLKPDNVMLVARAEQLDHVKVLDFGIAKITADDVQGQPALTQFGSVFGTPEYMSPEQAMGMSVDHRSDLYALGVMLHEMLTGATPFHDEDLMVVLTQQMTAPPPPLPATIPADMAALVGRLLEKQPDARPAEAGAVAAALTPHASVALASGATVPAPAAGGVELAPPSPAPGEAGMSAGERFRDALGSAHAAVRPHLARLRPLLVREVVVAGRRLPAWLFLVAAAGLLAGAALGARAFARDSAAPAEPSPLTLGSAVRRAITGEAPAVTNPRAIAVIEARPEAERSARDWRTLALDLAARADLGSALTAVGNAIRAEPQLEADPALLSLVRRAADGPDSAVALDLAARMGRGGADVLFDVWRAAQGDPSRRTAAAQAEQRLSRPEVRAAASEALKLALELRPGRSCLEYKKLLASAGDQVDERAEPYLAKLSKRELCRVGRFGFRQVDCWACLRGDDELPRALERARRTPGPRFAPPAPP